MIKMESINKWFRLYLQHAQEQLNVQMEMQELNGIHEVVKVLQNENSHRKY